ncbi:hypothetical protein FO519_008929 [Halicephalobus sp. NKZ332]|nr:hypothetical protein FO519_008929 [Halicephalobus sp. NKZ332]
MLEKVFLTLFLIFLNISEAIYINPYSVGSYDPAAENPYYYQYYSRYYNPNPHNPYAPYPTYLKKGYFTLPRMYRIDPSWVQYYPGSAGSSVYPNSPDYFNYPHARNAGNYGNQPGNIHSLPSMRRGKNPNNPESIAIFPDECGSSAEESPTSQRNYNIGYLPQNRRGTVVRSPAYAVSRSSWGTAVRSPGYAVGRPLWGTAPRSPGYVAARAPGEPKTETEILLENLENEDRPKWSDTAPSDDVLTNFGRPATLVRPRVPRDTGYPQPELGSQTDEEFGEESSNQGGTRDFERLPIDRISYNKRTGAHDGSSFFTG